MKGLQDPPLGPSLLKEKFVRSRRTPCNSDSDVGPVYVYINNRPDPDSDPEDRILREVSKCSQVSDCGYRAQVFK